MTGPEPRTMAVVSTLLGLVAGLPGLASCANAVSPPDGLADVPDAFDAPDGEGEAPCGEGLTACGSVTLGAGAVIDAGGGAGGGNGGTVKIFSDDLSDGGAVSAGRRCSGPLAGPCG